MLIRINGHERVESVTIKNRQSNKEKTIKTSGVFIYAGFLPNTDFLRDVVELNASGYIITNNLMQTSVPGIFAAGDVRSKELRQVVTAVSDGALAAIMAQRYIKENA
jgi:thioredoxin reductase (NADPH)